MTGYQMFLGVFASWLCASAFPQGFSQRFEEIKKTATKEQLYGFLYDLPKGGDLHNHLGLSYLPEMWYEAATSPKVTRGNEFYTRTRIANCPETTDPLLIFRTIQRTTYNQLSHCGKSEYQPLAKLTPALKQQWLSAMKLDAEGEGRHEFFEVIVGRLNELARDPNVNTELLIGNMKRFGAEGLRYLEPQVTVNFRDREGNPIDAEKAAQIWREALSRPEAKATGVTVRFQSTMLRFTPQAEQILENNYKFVDRNRDLWVGINMAGREDNDKGFALRFLDTFRKMRRTYSGIGLSIHGGEVDSPGPNVRDTLLLGATRIGHGLNLITDPDTMLLMRNNKYLVEINLISNRLLEYVPDLSKHPFPEFLRFGIPVCLNTDDPGVWDSNMTDEYYTAVTHFNLTWDEIVELGRNSLTYSFAEPAAKRRLLEEYQAAVSEFEKKYGHKSWAETLKKVKPVSSGYAARTFGIGPQQTNRQDAKARN